MSFYSIPNHDFLLAKLKHIDWRIRFFAFLDGKNTLSQEEITSPHCCELGSWLDKEGLQKYQDWSEISRLSYLHTQLHSISCEIILQKNRGENIETTYDTLKQISCQIIELLETLEKKLQNN